MSFVSCRSSRPRRVRGKQLAHARGVLAGAVGAREPGVEVERLRERLDALDLEAGASSNSRHSSSE